MKFYDFVYGYNIILRTDHKSLEAIFGPKQGMPLTAASKLQRWAYFLSDFRYLVETVKSKQNGNCDALSRLQINDSTDVFGSNFTPMYFVKENITNVDWQKVSEETKEDKILRNLMKYCMLGWPNNCKDSSFFTNKEMIMRAGPGL